MPRHPARLQPWPNSASACSAGGTAEEGVLEVQGEHVERVDDLLEQAGHPAKRAGG